MIELLVVIAILAGLAAILLPVLGRAKMKAQAIQCENHLKQFGLAWALYSAGYGEWVPPNNAYGASNTWVRGWLELYKDPSLNPDNTNTLHLAASLLSPYFGAALGIWRCPTDKSGLARSVSMNAWLNCQQTPDGYAGLPNVFRVIRRTGDMTTPSPTQTYVFTEERSDSTNDGYFSVFMGWAGPQAFLLNYPASYHNGGGTWPLLMAIPRAGSGVLRGRHPRCSPT